MPSPQLDASGRPTMTVSQRRQYFEDCRFLEVRHLAYIHYKKPDQTPILKYEDTLDNREMVKSLVLNYEIAAGWLIPDGTEGQVQVPAQPQLQQPLAAPQGAPQMQPFQPPPNGTPVPMQQAPVPQPQMQMQPPPMFAQPQPQMQAPIPQQAPQQYAQQPVPQQQAAPQPQQQEAPAAAPTGRRRKGQGTAVAPPPAAPPPQPQGSVPVQQFAPPQQQGLPFNPGAPQMAPMPQGGPPPMFGTPAPAPTFQTPPQPQFGAPATQAQPAAPAVVDLGPVIQRVDALAKIIEAQATELKTVKNINLQILTVLQHMYLTNQQLAQNTQGKDVRSLPDFQGWLQQFIGNPS